MNAVFMCSQPSMSSQRTSLLRSRGRMELWFCIHSVWVFRHETCRNVCEKCVTKRSNVPLCSLGHLHVLRSGHRLRWLLCALSWENIWGWGTAWSFYLHLMEILGSCCVYFSPPFFQNLQLSEDVAGATFMAAGSSAPELFTSLIG